VLRYINNNTEHRNVYCMVEYVHLHKHAFGTELFY
jgi:hypothetical protein